jgi:hypothetical protein
MTVHLWWQRPTSVAFSRSNLWSSISGSNVFVRAFYPCWESKTLFGVPSSLLSYVLFCEWIWYFDPQVSFVVKFGDIGRWLFFSLLYNYKPNNWPYCLTSIEWCAMMPRLWGMAFRYGKSNKLVLQISKSVSEKQICLQVKQNMFLMFKENLKVTTSDMF